MEKRLELITHSPGRRLILADKSPVEVFRTLGLIAIITRASTLVFGKTNLEYGGNYAIRFK